MENRQNERLHRLLKRGRGFTLTELLVVIAITTILLGLLFIPIIQGFNLTRQAQNESQAQGATRVGLAQITRELRQAAYIFDNTNAPIVIPLKFQVGVGPGGALTNLPHVLFGKLDCVLSATGGLKAGDAVDPTTGRGMTGAALQLPLAPGVRVVRYFLGLKRNLNTDGTVSAYENIYEFKGDQGQNALTLYRAEFDPRDPKLFDLANYNSPLDNDGGFNDPSFFYNTKTASNGRSYAANWKAIASPVVDGPNQDMLAWRRDTDGNLLPEAPLRTLVLFTPGTVVGDTATPGFMNAGASEAPNAVPTLYSAREGLWVLPFGVTFYRASSGAGARPSAGTLQLRFVNEPQANGSTRVRVVKDSATGSLATADNQFYTSVSPSTGKFFVKTPNLAFVVDPSRGRVETGFLPLAGNANGAPIVNASGSLNAVPAGEFPTVGDLVPMALRMITRDPNAGNVVTPTNQGLVTASPLILGNTAPYFLETIPPSATTYPSPMQVFGNVAGGVVQAGGGLMISPGTERLMGPDLNAGSSALSTLVAWYRIPGALSSVLKKSSLIDDPLDSNVPVRKRWAAATGSRTYLLDQDTRPNELAQLIFDEASGPGLPARAVTDANTVPEKQIYLSYLWQNNYARRVGGAQNGWAVDTGDNTLVDLAGGAVQGRQSVVPEPDVVKVDYSTRSQLVVNFGVNVYNSQTKRPTSIQLSDRVKVGNLGR